MATRVAKRIFSATVAIRSSVVVEIRVEMEVDTGVAVELQISDTTIDNAITKNKSIAVCFEIVLSIAYHLEKIPLTRKAACTRRVERSR